MILYKSCIQKQFDLHALKERKSKKMNFSFYIYIFEIKYSLLFIKNSHKNVFLRIQITARIRSNISKIELIR